MLCLSVLDGEYIAWSDNLKKRKWEVPVVFFLSILIVDPSQAYNYPLAINRFSNGVMQVCVFQMQEFSNKYAND